MYVPTGVTVHVPPSMEMLRVITEVAASDTIYTTGTLPLTTFNPGNEPAIRVMLAVGAVLSTLKLLVTVAA